MLPCLVFFQNGVACDRAVGFDDYGASDDFSTTAVERRLLKSGETCTTAFKVLPARTSRNENRNQSMYAVVVPDPVLHFICCTCCSGIETTAS